LVWAVDAVEFVAARLAERAAFAEPPIAARDAAALAVAPPVGWLVVNDSWRKISRRRDFVRRTWCKLCQS
jgi:hypothetical protein